MSKLAGLTMVVCLFSIGPAQAAGLPAQFLGDWVNKDGADGIEVGGIHVGARTYHEPGYNCDIKSITPKNEAGSVNRGLVYILDMSCGRDDLNSKNTRVREIWALRKINGKELLVMAGIAGSTYPSIHILQRP